MRLVVQRVAHAAVSVDGEVVAVIGPGLLVLAGIAGGDGIEDVKIAAEKLVNLRIFADDEQKMNRSVKDVQGEILVVSQFTLLGDTSRGRRPSFVAAARPEHAEPLVEQLALAIRSHGVETSTGVFGARMIVELANDGPVTLVLEIAEGKVSRT